MPQSRSKIYLHLIFHVKTASPRIRREDDIPIHSYIGRLVNNTGCTNIWGGGADDHVHILLLLSKDVMVSHVVEEIKRNSSRWIKTMNAHYRGFAWQGGYGVFSVSQSVVDKTLSYIKRQREHHQKYSFAEEYRKFLESYGVSYNEEFVFKD